VEILKVFRRNGEEVVPGDLREVVPENLREVVPENLEEEVDIL
jgi:hypothetical protein